ncbi:MAG: LysR family transcriptional regulator [Burkholderiales bacterium]|nr:LysR family transcriptional regulator [Burkholderiales bacterium]
MPDAVQLDIKLLQLFELIYRTHSVTRAAEQLGLSQPTVSIWLGKLRRQFDDPLFVRTSMGMLPTPRAEALITTAREVLESWRRLLADPPAFDPAAATRRFRVCMTDASHITLLPQLLAHVRALAPAVQLVVTRIDGDTARALEAGDADVAIGYVPWLEAGFYQQALYPQDWVCLANRNHPRIAKVLSLRAYRSEAHVSITAGTGAQLLEQALARQATALRVVLELPGFLGLGGVIAASDLVATLPRHIGETLAGMAGLRVLACPLDVPSFTVKQHWHARFHEDPGNRWLRGVMAGLFMRKGKAIASPARSPSSPASTSSLSAAPLR